jgi:hypothetical protein
VPGEHSRVPGGDPRAGERGRISVIDRFTRDAASKYVWAVMALAAAGAFTFAVLNGDSAVHDERANAQIRAVQYVEVALAPRIEGLDLSEPITGLDAESLDAAVGRTILADPRLFRVRIWSDDGRILFSTDRSDTPGSAAGLNDELLRQASTGGVLTRSDVTDTGGESDPERSLLRTYVPMQASAIAEIDQTNEGTLAAVRTKWLFYQLLAGVLLFLFLVLTGLSLRDPIELINVGVPFAASSIPAGYSLIDDDRLQAVHEVYRLASERVERMQLKLEESEEARRRLEGEIQRVLSKAATAPRADHTPPIAPPAPAPAPPVVRVPESDVVVTPPDAEWSSAPAGPLARAARDQKPPPSAPRTAKPPVEKPKRASSRRKRAKEEQPAGNRQESTPPQPAPAPEPRLATVAATPATPAAPAARPISGEQEIADAKAHEDALEMFIRLTETDRQPHDTSAVDQGAVRAALARTAARKKPGGERLQPHDKPAGESPGKPRDRR